MKNRLQKPQSAAHAKWVSELAAKHQGDPLWTDVCAKAQETHAVLESLRRDCKTVEQSIASVRQELDDAFNGWKTTDAGLKAIDNHKVLSAKLLRARHEVASHISAISRFVKNSPPRWLARPSTQSAEHPDNRFWWTRIADHFLGYPRWEKVRQSQGLDLENARTLSWQAEAAVAQSESDLSDIKKNWLASNSDRIPSLEADISGLSKTLRNIQSAQIQAEHEWDEIQRSAQKIAGQEISTRNKSRPTQKSASYLSSRTSADPSPDMTPIWLLAMFNNVSVQASSADHRSDPYSSASTGGFSDDDCRSSGFSDSSPSYSSSSSSDSGSSYSSSSDSGSSSCDSGSSSSCD